MSIDKVLAYLLSCLYFLLGFIVGSIFTALTGMLINKHRVYLEAKRKHYQEIHEEIKRFTRLINSFEIVGGKILCRNPRFGGYFKPEIALDYIERIATHFLEHYPKVKKKLLNAIKFAKAHNDCITQLRRDIETSIKKRVEKSEDIRGHLLLSGIVSLMLFDFFDHQGFLIELIEKKEYSFGADNTLMLGGFGVAKISDDDSRQEVIAKIFSFLGSLHEEIRTKYSEEITRALSNARELLSRIKGISEYTSKILRKYKVTGKFDGKCSECPKLIKYLIPPW